MDLTLTKVQEIEFLYQQSKLVFINKWLINDFILNMQVQILGNSINVRAREQVRTGELFHMHFMYIIYMFKKE